MDREISMILYLKFVVVCGYVLDEFPAPPGSAYAGGRPGQPGYEQDQRPYGQAGGTRPYGQDQRPGYGADQAGGTRPYGQDQRPGYATDQRQGRAFSTCRIRG